MTRRLVTATAIASLVSLAACQRGENRLSFPKASVIVISVDTLRADRLPAYGYAKVETPAIDALRKDSILFENAYSHVPLTLPSHAALFTGLLPPQNGVRDNLGYRLRPDGPETMASFFGKAGYTTGGAVSSAVLARPTGVGRGFSFWDDEVEDSGATSQSLIEVEREGGVSAARLGDWIRRQPKEVPVFAFLHLFEPHSPYEPPEPLAIRYQDRYDGEVARADEIVGSFLNMLRERGIYDEAIVVFLSDHGEGLRDHGEEEHGVLLYREAVHVPLLLKLPGGRRGGSRVAAPVGLTDLFPSLARLTALPPPAGLSGLDLTDVIAGRAAPARRIYSETLYPRLHLGWSDLASLVDERWHYIHGPRAELYDVLADSREKKDLAASLPPAFRAMRAELERMPRPLQPPGQSDPEQVAKLAALGYIGGQSPELDAKDLPNPVDRVEAVDRLKAGFGYVQKTQWAPAAAAFRELLKDNPRMTDVWLMLAQAEVGLGNSEAAGRAIQEAVRLAPGNPEVLLAQSDYFVVLGKYAEARQHAELARDGGAANAPAAIERLVVLLVRQGRDADAIALADAAQFTAADALTAVGVARARRGDLAGARRELEAALAADPAHPEASYQLGRVLLATNDPAGAAVRLEAAVAATPLLAAAWSELGQARARAGEEQKAIAAWKRAVELDARQYESLYNLAIASGRMGDMTTARSALRQFLDSAPAARFGRERREAQRLLSQMGGA